VTSVTSSPGILPSVFLTSRYSIGMRFVRPVSLVSLVVVAVGCSSLDAPKAKDKDTKIPEVTAHGSGAELLKEVVQTYAAGIGSFSAKSRTDITEGGKKEPGFSLTRTVNLAGPKINVVSSIGDLKFTVISDGETMVEASGSRGTKSYAPASVFEADTDLLQNFNVGGSLMYRLFAGPQRLEEVVKLKTPITLLANDDPKIAVLQFEAIDPYGTTRLFVDKATKQVVKYESQLEPVVKAAKDLPDSKVESLLLREVITEQTFAAKHDDKTFSTDLGKGVTLENRQLPGQSGAPMGPLSLVDLEGATMTHEDLKGKVVVLDFWATWCMPCVKSLPDTLAIQNEYAEKNVKVLAITEETRDEVKIFAKEHGLEDLHFFLDRSGNTNAAYGVNVLPTMIVINAEGKIVARMEGAQTKEDIAIALRRAGVK